MFDAHVPSDERLSVFVRTAAGLNDSAKSSLTRHGVALREGISIYAVDLTSDQIRALSEEPSVVSIRLARAARPLGLG
jgi:hypothetical protein